MHVVKSRWFAPAAICLALAFFAGCQIDSPNQAVGDLRYVRISPDFNLHEAPEGFIYELWIMSFEQEIIIDGDSVIVIVEPGLPASVVRFNWDPYLYAATDAQGNFIPITTGAGIEVPFDPNPYFLSEVVVGFLTLEPVNDVNPALPDGPNILVARLNTNSGIGSLVNPFAILTEPQNPNGTGGFGAPPPATSFTLLSQSNKKGVPNAAWRDGQTEGYGIWFANPRLDETTVIDTVHGWDAFTTVFSPPDEDPYLYTVWIHRERPESSFSNFGLAMLDREPDFESRDGVPIHAPGRYGPSDPIPVQGDDPIPGVELGTDPVMENGTLVGYRYVVNRGTDAQDTCIVRIDDPSLSRCNGDNFETLNFTDTSFLPYTFRLSTGDTTVGPTLGALLDLSDPERLNEATFGNAFIFAGWEYEAWLVFTEESGIPPLSMGRFKDPADMDSNNPFTFTDGRYDRNFTFPGEDFLQNLSQHHPSLSSPLDVINDPRVEKIWITIEPDGDLGLDWAPDEPNTQFIYLSAFVPKFLPPDVSAQFPMVHRDLNPSPTGLNNGNYFPRLTVRFNSGPEN